MPADLTREEIERLPGVLAEMESRLHFGGDPEDDRPATEVWSELWFCDADYMLVFSAARSALSEPTRLAAARQEGYQEGVEAAARWLFDRAELLRARARASDKADWRHKEQHAADHLEIADHAIRKLALSPPPAEPSAPVAEGAPDDPMAALAAVNDLIAALEAENAALKAKMAEADRALAPFAGIGAWLFARDLPDATPVIDLVGINGASGALTRGHFKAAHTARTLLQGQGGGDA